LWDTMRVRYEIFQNKEEPTGVKLRIRSWIRFCSRRLCTASRGPLMKGSPETRCDYRRRHTALVMRSSPGALLKLIPLLRTRDSHAREALEARRKTYLARVKY